MNEFGIVSNCWRAELDAGIALDALLAEADARGYRHVELRQDCMGAYESASDGGAWPDDERLGLLPARFPRLRFNVAMALPFLGGEVRPESPLFAAGVRAAVAVGGDGGAHLRLVDPQTAPKAVARSNEEKIAERLAALARTCIDRGALLSVENARQPWAALRRILASARERLGADAGALRLCYDPCNLLAAADRPNPEAETGRLRADEIALFHLKQSQGGALLPEVGPGEIDWSAQRAALHQIGYAGPCLFEIPPGPEIWERLERSRRAVRG